MPLLKVDDLSVCFKSVCGSSAVVNKVSFSVDEAEILAIVGESGSGKSVTALSIMQLLPYPVAYHPEGSILFKGQQMIGLSETNMCDIRGNKISMIFQEPMTSLNPLHTIGKQISEVILLHRVISKQKVIERCIELLELVGLESLKDRLETYPHELSGGQRQRVIIAMALACEPNLLIADEPTTALDVTIQEQILKLIKELQKKINMSVILITHDLTIVRKIADRVCVMYKGEIVETAKTKDIFTKASHEYTKHLLSCEPRGRAIKLNSNSQKILETENLTVTFPLKRNFFGKPTKILTALNTANISLQAGETLGVVGESGSGKSTLASAILRLVKSKGKIVFFNNHINELSNEKMRLMRQNMQIVFQDPFASLNPRLSVSQIVKEGLKAHSIGNSEDERDEMVIKLLKDVGIDPEKNNCYPHEFSGGQRQRIAIARALVLNPDLIILDEPTSALDLSVQSQIIDLLRELQEKKKMSYIFISHDLRVVRAISHRIVVMKNGNIIEHGTVDDIFNNPQNNYTKSLILASGVS